MTNGFGRSKYTDKKYNKNYNIIYSRNTYKSTLQKCCTFLKYCREDYNVNNLSEINSYYFNQFVKDNQYSIQTANAYKTAISKLQNGYNSTYKTHFTWTNDKYKRFAINKNNSRQQMPKKLHDRIIEQAYKNKYENGLAFDLARSVGLRVSEITNLRMCDFAFNYSGNLDFIYIHRSKGGRNRKIFSKYLTTKQIQTINKVYSYFKPKKNKQDRLFINKIDSYRQAFSNARNTVTKEYNQCSIHSLRKEFAKDYYNRETTKNKSIQLVKQELTLLLGHNRIDILKAYL